MKVRTACSYLAITGILTHWLDDVIVRDKSTHVLPCLHHDLYLIIEYPENSEPYNFVAQAGVWEVRNYTNRFSRHGVKVNMQVCNQFATK